LEIANSTKKKYQDVLAEAGIKDPYDVLIQSMNHWDKMLGPSKLPSEEQLVQDLRQNFQLRVARAANVFVPPDVDFPAKNDDPEESYEKGEDINRIALALETLLHMKLGDEQLLIDDIEVVISRTPEHCGRTRPYWIINLKKQKIAVLINNQHANRTFVIGYKTKSDLEKLERYTKGQLKELSTSSKMVHHFIYKNFDQFRGDLTNAVQKVFEGKEMSMLYPTYEEASAAVKMLNVRSGNEYMRLKRYKEDPRLPSNPEVKYGDSFVSWGDFLGTGNISNTEISKKFYSTYKEACTAARRLGFKSESEYTDGGYRKDSRLPSSPYRLYGDDFISWGDYLGTDSITTKERGNQLYQTYGEASAAAKRLKILTEPEYARRYAEDIRLPAQPDNKYGDDFIGWGDFLGTGNISNIEKSKKFYDTYEEASAAAKELGIRSFDDYQVRHKEDPRLPPGPSRRYKSAFINWGDFLGTENISPLERRNQHYKTYEEASAAAKKLKIKSGLQYTSGAYKKDPRLPSQPNNKYKDSWKGWKHFLGTE
jgi:hypothetical protein